MIGDNPAECDRTICPKSLLTVTCGGAWPVGRYLDSGMGDAMLTALILVCSIAITPDLADCSVVNARVVMRTPETYVSPVTCAMHGQAYLAETAVGRMLSKNDRVKVICMRPEQADQTIADLEKR